MYWIWYTWAGGWHMVYMNDDLSLLNRTDMRKLDTGGHEYLLAGNVRDMTRTTIKVWMWQSDINWYFCKVKLILQNTNGFSVISCGWPSFCCKPYLNACKWGYVQYRANSTKTETWHIILSRLSVNPGLIWTKFVLGLPRTDPLSDFRFFLFLSCHQHTNTVDWSCAETEVALKLCSIVFERWKFWLHFSNAVKNE